MKISKLFHWLYAILMLLPFLIFIPNAFYYGFNEHAVAQEKTEQIPVYYESNEINDINDIYVGNIYSFNDNYSFTSSGYNRLMNLNIDLIRYQYPTLVSDTTSEIFIQLGNNTLRLVIDNVPYDMSTLSFKFIPLEIFSVNLINTYLLPYISETDFKYVKEYQPVTTNMSITDSMSYAWDSVWQNDLFSWSYGSFLTEPFIYIGNVFNVPEDNALYYALSYWLDISIIWLCFDMVMYIPLLVHRWLDKGIIE